jgi:hypothetical protein
MTSHGYPSGIQIARLAHRLEYAPVGYRVKGERFVTPAGQNDRTHDLRTQMRLQAWVVKYRGCL